MTSLSCLQRLPSLNPPRYPLVGYDRDIRGFISTIELEEAILRSPPQPPPMKGLNVDVGAFNWTQELDIKDQTTLTRT